MHFSREWGAILSYGKPMWLYLKEELARSQQEEKRSRYADASNP